MRDSENMKEIKTTWSSDHSEFGFEVENPATGEVMAFVYGASAEEVDAAVREADRAFNEEWRWKAPRERAKLLLDCSRVLREHADEIARIESEENGKPFTQARHFDLEFCINSFEMYGGLIAAMPSEAREFGPVAGISTLEPYGVIAGIIPFNWPPIHTAAKAAPALAVGNTVVLKAPEQCPLSIIKIVELLNTVLPAGVLTVLPGRGPVGEMLCAHPLVRKISFTGAPSTGMAVMRTAAQNLTPTLMELGGKNPFIVFEDANVDDAVRSIIEGAFFNQGQACTAASRILVHQSHHDEIVEKLSTAVIKLRVGDPSKPETHVGPLVTAVQQQRVQNYIQIGIDEGAVIAAQAALPTDPALEGGYWAAPTLFTNVQPDMRIAREEIFGPVTVVIPFESYEEAIQIANNTDFGLVAGIYTQDFSLAWKASREIDAGIVFVNNYYRNFLGNAFGGTRHSGYGREHALETLQEFGRTKTVRFPTGIGEIPRWFAANEVIN